MVISKNSQLGLMMEDPHLHLEFYEAQKYHIGETMDFLNDLIKKVEGMPVNENGMVDINLEEYANYDLPAEDFTKVGTISQSVSDKIINSEFNNENFIDNTNAKLFLICDGVDKCSKMIRIGDNFSSKALRNIKFGKYTYLMGKNEMCRFICAPGAIKGVYWNREKKEAFEFGFDIENDGYYFTGAFAAQFNKVAKIITFVELGDIDVEILETGRNNGKPKNDGKVTNTSEYTVYVVDSSWNKLIIRTEGFAVMGHFRLQSCGPGLVDRKLIWINAFEKHGYKRSPKAKIIH